MASTIDTSLFSLIDESLVAKEKAPNALRTISEAAEALDVPQHVLRFWETKFAQIKPLKRNGGRRFYRPQDLDILQQIKHLLYSQGYTIKGAQKAVADYVALRAAQRDEVVAVLKPSFAPAHGNDNAPVIAPAALEPESLAASLAEPDLLEELALALAVPEPDLFQPTPAPQPAGISRTALAELREAIASARDALAVSLAA